ncbi:hypothetical protein D6C90_07999 [Aureobasidium pullulans]|uniref:Uncharacterized protein n=1 Tax=Aureobasidium pullulans TaxID=5580 RepID=A0A4S9U751_AURPU|nr:hypothetical protein D6C90_07999 [Aureobasidium pullulans]
MARTLTNNRDSPVAHEWMEEFIAYELDDWKEATRKATFGQHVHKSYFDNLLKFMQPRTRTWIHVGEQDRARRAAARTAVQDRGRKFIVYDKGDWNVASCAAFCQGSPVKHMFEEALTGMQYIEYTVPYPRRRVRFDSHGNVTEVIWDRDSVENVPARRRRRSRSPARHEDARTTTPAHLERRHAQDANSPGFYSPPPRYTSRQPSSGTASHTHSPQLPPDLPPPYTERAQDSRAREAHGHARRHHAPMIRHQAPVNVSPRRRSRSRFRARIDSATAASRHRGASIDQHTGRDQLPGEARGLLLVRPPRPPPPPPPGVPSQLNSDRRQVYTTVNSLPRSTPPRRTTHPDRGPDGRPHPNLSPPYVGHQDRNGAVPPVARQHPRRFAVDEGRPPFAADQPVSGQEARNLIALEKEAAALMRLMQELRHRDLLVLD